METKQKSSINIIPNDGRILVKLLTSKSIYKQEANIIMPGQLKAGDQLLYGEIVHPGSTKFKVGQRIYYSEYSAAQLYQLGRVAKGELTYGESMDDKNELFVVAADDIMAYEEETANVIEK